MLTEGAEAASAAASHTVVATAPRNFPAADPGKGWAGASTSFLFNAQRRRRVRGTESRSLKASC